MSDLIKFENGQLVSGAIKFIQDTEKELKEAKERSDHMKQELLEAMESNGIVKIDTDDILINYIAPSESERFDSKALKENCPDLYDEFVKFTPVKASIRIKIK